MATAGRVNVNATMDTAKFEAGVRRISRGVKSMQATTTKSLYHIQKAQKAVTAGWTLMRSAAAAFAAGYGVKLVSRALQLADNIAKVADKVGISTDALQELQFAASQTGVNINTLNMGLQRFSRRIGEALKGKGELVKNLKAYDIKLLDAYGNVRALEDIIGDYAEAVKNAGSANEQLEMTFKAVDSEAAGMVNLFRQGREGISKYAQQARDLGIVLDENLLRNAETTRDRFSALSDVIALKFTAAVVEATPALNAMADALLSWVQAVNEVYNVTVFRYLSLEIEALLEEQETLIERLKEGANYSLIEQIQGAALLMRGVPGGAMALADKNLAETRDRLDEINQRLDELREKRNRILGIAPDNIIEPKKADTAIDIGFPTTTISRQADAILDAIRSEGPGISTYGDESFARLFDDLPAQINDVKSSLDRAELFEGFRLDAQETTAAFEMMNLEIIGSTQVMAEESRAATEEMSEFAIQAARSIQSSFADLLFDPFGSSLEDMLLKWTETLRRMAAEAAAAAILEALFPATAAGGGLGGFLSGLMGRQHGGHVSRGKPYWVGEAGKELFVPAQSGTVVPQGKMGGVNIAYNIDARGATRELVDRLPGILETERKRTIYEVSELMRRGRM